MVHLCGNFMSKYVSIPVSLDVVPFDHHLLIVRLVVPMVIAMSDAATVPRVLQRVFLDRLARLFHNSVTRCILLKAVAFTLDRDIKVFQLSIRHLFLPQSRYLLLPFVHVVAR